MDRDLDERLLDFAVRVVRLVKMLPSSAVGRRLGDQLLRCGTSVGANYQEAQGAESKEDFTHKLQVALKEAREARYWLRVLGRSETVASKRLGPLLDESDQICSILSKAVATAKGTTKS